MFGDLFNSIWNIFFDAEEETDEMEAFRKHIEHYFPSYNEAKQGKEEAIRGYIAQYKGGPRDNGLTIYKLNNTQLIYNIKVARTEKLINMDATVTKKFVLEIYEGGYFNEKLHNIELDTLDEVYSLLDIKE